MSSAELSRSRYVWPESALRAGDLSYALNIALETLQVRLMQEQDVKRVSIEETLKQANPCELAVLAMIRSELSRTEQRYVNAASRIDQRLLPRSLTRDQQLEAAIQPLAQADLAIEAPEWIDDPDTVGLVAGAESRLSLAGEE